GRLLVANVSFMSAATGWIRDAQGNRLHYPIDDYFTEREQQLSWAGIEIVNWHRPLGAYMEAYLRAGLILREFIEPYPPDDSLRDNPRFEDWYRVPNFTVMLWEKPA
ncbi:MAG: SAM-dependent methyltransferase, partial [Hyphomicrobiales bacterium]